MSVNYEIYELVFKSSHETYSLFVDVFFGGLILHNAHLDYKAVFYLSFEDVSPLDTLISATQIESDSMSTAYFEKCLNTFLINSANLSELNLIKNKADAILMMTSPNGWDFEFTYHELMVCQVYRTTRTSKGMDRLLILVLNPDLNDNASIFYGFYSQRYNPEIIQALEKYMLFIPSVYVPPRFFTETKKLLEKNGKLKYV